MDSTLEELICQFFKFSAPTFGHFFLFLRMFGISRLPPRRSNDQAFFRVMAGQIAQKFQNLGLVTDTLKGSASNRNKLSFWMHRPFTRVVRGGKRAYNTIRDYIRLNEQEALGEIPYRKERQKGLSPKEWQALWN